MKPSSQMMKYIETAKEIERTGLKFYKGALRKMKDPNSKGLLKFLIKEEEEHLDYFMKLGKKLKQDEGLKKLKKYKNPLFRKKDYKKVSGKKTETLHVFATALEMEERGIKFYLKMAKSTKDASLRKFLISLAEMEKKHFRMIKEHQDAIYDAWYWEAMDMPALNT